MSDNPMMPQPTDEHRMLQRDAGQWNVECTMYYGPDTPPSKYPAEETIEAFGPFWIMSHHRTAPHEGFQFESRMMIGFDPVAGQFISTYVSTLAAQEARFTGSYDADTKTIHWTGSGMGPLGPETQFRAEDVAESDDAKVFRMWAYNADTPEYLLMEYRYTRKK